MAKKITADEVRYIAITAAITAAASAVATSIVTFAIEKYFERRDEEEATTATQGMGTLIVSRGVPVAPHLNNTLQRPRVIRCSTL